MSTSSEQASRSGHKDDPAFVRFTSEQLGMAGEYEVLMVFDMTSDDKRDHRGRHRISDNFTVALNEKDDVYEATFANLGIGGVLVESAMIHIVRLVRGESG